MQKQGKVAHYIEPHNPDGRSPHGLFRVLLINKKDRQGVVLAAQQTTQWTCIVRSGMRFGLRVKTEDAQTAHEFHKPNIPCLATDDIILFHAAIPAGIKSQCTSQFGQVVCSLGMAGEAQSAEKSGAKWKRGGMGGASCEQTTL